MPTLTAVITPVPKALVSLSLKRLDVTVPEAIIMDTMPAPEMGTSSSWYMAGQAAPRRESGSPRLMKAR